MNKKLLGDALERPDIESFKGQRKMPVIVLLDDIRSLSNVGSIFRTCDGFNVKEMILCGITGRPPHRDIQRTALGATESVDWSYHEHTDAALAMLSSSYDDIRLISVEQAEQSLSPHLVLDQLDWNEDTMFVVVLGNEVNGVKQSVIDRSDLVAEIPQSGTKHSLNVTVAAGVVLWEMYKGLEL
jgi:tRNA G18 (ribose-2'-O)-methylase SpoU